MGFLRLVAIILPKALKLIGQGVGVLTLGEIIQLVYGEIGGEPSSVEEGRAAETVARTVAHIIEDDNIFQAVDRRNPERMPTYLTLNCLNGQAWWHFQYNSSKSMNAQFKRGRANGELRERRRLASEAGISSEGSR